MEMQPSKPESIRPATTFAEAPMKYLIILALIASTAAQSLPDKKLTPGVIRTTNAKEICAKSFRTKPFRKTTPAMKKHVCDAYHVKAKCPGTAQEIDHLVPLELGGMDDER